MSEATATLPSQESVSVPVRSGWRRALVVFTLLGAGLYGLGQLAGRYDTGFVPATAMIMATMLGPIVALLGFGLWWMLLGDGRWWKRLLSLFAIGLCVGAVLLAADSSIRPFVMLWGVPLSVGVTGLVLLFVPQARWLPAVCLIGVMGVSPWLAVRLDGVTGKFELDVSYRWKPSVSDAAANQLADRSTVVPTNPVAEVGKKAPEAEAEAAEIDKKRVKMQDEFIAAVFEKEISKLPKEMQSEARLARNTPEAKRTPAQKKLMQEHPGLNVSADSLYLYDAKAAAVLKKMTDEAAEVRQKTALEDWTGFRGPQRTGEVPLVSYRGWDGKQPRELWRKKTIGPAWSSFCVVGDFVCTQEQRGNSESVVCYRADNGEEVWARGEEGKHSDLPSGAGPRATPSFAKNRVFAVTASGVISCLQAGTGEPIWHVNLSERFGATKPVFGLSTSPLIVGDLVIVNPASPSAPRLVALSTATGETRWETEAKGTDGYSSPHLTTLANTSQILIFNGNGLFGHDPASGRELWNYDWVTKQNEPTTMQPLVLPDGRIVVGGGNVGVGTRCVKVKHEGDKWSTSEVWKTTRFTPKFNDMIRVGEHLFGLDGGYLVCLKLADGSISWKEGDYGAGQLLLVGDKLLIATEKGKLVCVAAKPEEYEELWQMDAVKGKTWNHPALARGRLYFRNATQMAVFDLPGWTSKP